MSGREYFADATPEEAWELLSSERSAALVDVRTTAEWAYVGWPDLSPIGDEIIRVEWQTYPSGQINPNFVQDVSDALRQAGIGPDADVLFVCRSGGRSASAAAAMTKAGFQRCYNVSGGFEGPRDEHGHRGTVDGWKAANLPWTQP